MVRLGSRSRLAGEIAILIVVKLALLAGIYKLWFDEPLSEGTREQWLSDRIYPSGASATDGGRGTP